VSAQPPAAKVYPPQEGGRFDRKRKLEEAQNAELKAQKSAEEAEIAN